MQRKPLPFLRAMLPRCLTRGPPHAPQAEGGLSMSHFRRRHELGSGDAGTVHLVELVGGPSSARPGGGGHLFALKSLDKGVTEERNKVRI